MKETEKLATTSMSVNRQIFAQLMLTVKIVWDHTVVHVKLDIPATAGRVTIEISLLKQVD